MILSQSRKTGFEEIVVTMEANVSVAKTDAPPALVLSNSFEVPSTSFDVHQNSSKDKLLCSSESSIEWHANSLSSEACGYAIAAYNKRTGEMQFIPAEVFQAKPQPLKQLKRPAELISGSADRRQLGTTFGTKKAIRSLNAAERDRIDATSTAQLDELQPMIQEQITETTTHLNEIPVTAINNDIGALLPPHNFQADEVSNVYPLERMVTTPELQKLRSIASKNSESLLEYLPHRKSTIVNQCLENVDSLPAHERRDAIVLGFLLSFHLAFRKSRTYDRSKLAERFSNVPQELIDGMLDRFTAPTRNNSNDRKMSDNDETKILFYILALSFHATNYSFDTPVVAKDCELAAKKVKQYLKIMGSVFQHAEGESRTKDRATLQIPMPIATEEDIKNRKSFARK